MVFLLHFLPSYEYRDCYNTLRLIIVITATTWPWDYYAYKVKSAANPVYQIILLLHIMYVQTGRQAVSLNNNIAMANCIEWQYNSKRW